MVPLPVALQAVDAVGALHEKGKGKAQVQPQLLLNTYLLTTELNL